MEDKDEKTQLKEQKTTWITRIWNSIKAKFYGLAQRASINNDKTIVDAANREAKSMANKAITDTKDVLKTAWEDVKNYDSKEAQEKLKKAIPTKSWELTPEQKEDIRRNSLIIKQSKQTEVQSNEKERIE